MYDRPLPLNDPVRPPEIVNVGSIRTVPAVVGVLVGIAIALGFASAMLFDALGRRHDLAVLRALGFGDRQLRRSLRVQSVVTAVLTAGLGMVAGTIVGRSAWRLFAAELGVVPDPRVPVVAPLAVIAAAAVLGLLAAIVPGLFVIRPRSGQALRTL